MTNPYNRRSFHYAGCFCRCESWMRCVRTVLNRCRVRGAYTRSLLHSKHSQQTADRIRNYNEVCASAAYLGHVNKLGENLSSQLRCRPAQHHELHPLGDTITQGDGTFHCGDVLHAAAADVALVVGELQQNKSKNTDLHAAWKRNAGAVCDSNQPQALSTTCYLLTCGGGEWLFSCGLTVCPCGVSDLIHDVS